MEPCPQNLHIEGHTAKTFYITFFLNTKPGFDLTFPLYLTSFNASVVIVNNINQKHQYQQQSVIRITFDDNQWICNTGVIISKIINKYNNENPSNAMLFVHMSTKHPDCLINCNENVSTFRILNGCIRSSSSPSKTV